MDEEIVNESTSSFQSPQEEGLTPQMLGQQGEGLSGKPLLTSQVYI